MKKYVGAEALKLKFAVESAEASARDPNNKVFVAMCKAINDVAEKTIDEMFAVDGDLVFLCPRCRIDIGYIDALAYEMPKYCPECGQAIDRSVVPGYLLKG